MIKLSKEVNDGRVTVWVEIDSDGEVLNAWAEDWHGNEVDLHRYESVVEELEHDYRTTRIDAAEYLMGD